MRRYTAAILVALALTLAGCKHREPAPAKTVTSSFVVNPQGGTANFPAIGGYTATFAYGPNNAYGATATVTSSIGNLPKKLPGGPPTATPIVAYTIMLDRSTTFTVWHHFVTTFTLPYKQVTTGQVFRDYVYDLTQKSKLGFDDGTIVDSQTVTFDSPSGSVTYLAGHRYLMVVTRL